MVAGSWLCLCGRWEKRLSLQHHLNRFMNSALPFTTTGGRRSFGTNTNPPSSSSSSSSDSEDEEEANKQRRRSFVASYLVNSCGLSPETADSISNKYKVNFQSSSNPDSVLTLLRNHGFSQTHISKVIRSHPTLLLHSAEKNLLPKIEFFHSIIGLSTTTTTTDLVKVLSSCPALLSASLEKQLIPCIDLLKNVAQLDDTQILMALKSYPRSFTSNVWNNLAPNIALLRATGLPQSSISYLITKHPLSAFVTHTRFSKAVEEAKQLGFDPSKLAFVVAIRVLSTITKSNWESKFEVYGRWGWSRDQTLAAFTKFPGVMFKSEKKIMEVMHFLVNEMGWSWAPEEISRRPSLLNYSLEKRIVPRCYVVHVLQLKGLIKQDLSLDSFLGLVEKSFLEKYVFKFQISVPQLLNLYQGKVDLKSVENELTLI